MWPKSSLQKPIPLNSLEKFMLAHESSEVSYNSQIMVEFTGDIKLAKLRSAVDQAIAEIPLLRSHIEETKYNFLRYYKYEADFNSFDIIEERTEVLEQDAIDIFCRKKFDLSKSPAFRILIAKTAKQKNILIFNVHHTLCDAAGQFHLLEEFFRIMEGLPVREGAKTDQVFRYRHLRKFMGWKWFLKNIYSQLRPLKKQRQYKMASLVDHPKVPERFVTSMTVELNESEQTIIRESCKKLDISITEYLTHSCFIALDKSLKSRGDSKTPIMVYLPKTLRPLLKIRYSLQNILTTVWIVGKRDEIHGPKFLEKVKHVINSHKMDKAAKFIFGTLWASSVLKPQTLKNIFQSYDRDPEISSTSLLISAGRVPRSYTFPSGWDNLSVWARGAMLKSPGVGVIYTGVFGAETLTIEYLKGVVEMATVEDFKKNLLSELLK